MLVYLSCSDEGPHYLSGMKSVGPFTARISSHSEVCKWWAGYLESLGECDQALQFYEVAKDFPSLVRVLCSYGNFEKAAEIVEESGSRAAAYQLASRLRTEKEACVTVLT